MDDNEHQLAIPFKELNWSKGGQEKPVKVKTLRVTRRVPPPNRLIMQLMTFNSLLMFDIVFIFFLFLIVVTCLLYYLPPTKIRQKSQLDKRRSQQSVIVSNSNSSKSVLYVNGDDEPVESFIRCCKYCEKCKLIYEEVYSERRYVDDTDTSQNAVATSSGNYLKAKDCDIKNCKGPIYEV